jgi:galactoside O-acetyltransferase
MTPVSNFISPKASIYGNVEMGDNVRIDDFCILTGDIKLGSNIHIGCYCFLAGGYGIELEDFAQLSTRVSLFSGSDDFSGESLISPVIPDQFKPGLKGGKILMKRHALIGTNSSVLPGATMCEGAVLGAHSMAGANAVLFPWNIYAGVPARRIGARSKKMLELEKEFLEWQRLNQS